MISSSKHSVNEIKLNTDARSAVREYSKLFVDALLAQSKVLASTDGNDQVQAVHVARAYDQVLVRATTPRIWQQLFSGVGTLLLGAAIQGVYTEYWTAEPKASAFVFCFVTGLLGLFMWMLSIFKK